MARKTIEEILANRPVIDRVKLDSTTEADIERYRLEDGEPPDDSLDGFLLPASPAKVRQKLGLTQVAFAKAIRVPLATVRNWEQGRVRPEPAAQSLLTILYRRPDALEALRG